MTEIRFRDGSLLNATPDQVYYFVYVLKSASIVNSDPVVSEVKVTEAAAKALGISAGMHLVDEVMPLVEGYKGLNRAVANLRMKLYGNG